MDFETFLLASMVHGLPWMGESEILDEVDC